MAAPKGNKYYLLADNPGRPLIFNSPDELWEKTLEYFVWVDENPIITYDYKGGAATKCKYENQRPYTKSGLCVFLNISDDTFENYKKREGFLGIITYIEEIIRTQKFEGATVGIFNHNIIARDLGLVDKRENDNKGNITVTGFNYISPENETDNKANEKAT